MCRVKCMLLCIPIAGENRSARFRRQARSTANSSCDPALLGTLPLPSAWARLLALLRSRRASPFAERLGFAEATFHIWQNDMPDCADVQVDCYEEAYQLPRQPRDQTLVRDAGGGKLHVHAACLPEAGFDDHLKVRGRGQGTRQASTSAGELRRAQSKLLLPNGNGRGNRGDRAEEHQRLVLQWHEAPPVPKLGGFQVDGVNHKCAPANQSRSHNASLKGMLQKTRAYATTAPGEVCRELAK
jgi:hypothetical protein